MKVVKQEANNNQLALQKSELDEIFGDFKIDSSDILIPKILLMQPSSVFVNDGEAILGDFRNSVTKEKLGSITESFAFVPFHFTKCWSIVGPGGKWLRREEFKPGDENLPWEFDEGGVHLKRIKRIDFYGFPLKKLAEGVQLPMILSFQSTGYKEGTKILTQFMLNISKRKLPWSDVWGIKGEKRKNEDNQTYCVPMVDLVGTASEDELRVCMEWYKSIKNLSVKIIIDESDVQQEIKVESASNTTLSDTGDY
jgi:hypothetical protein